MCGIAGFLLRDGQAQRSTLATMCGRIRHRGPDDEGVHLDGPCGIGMRRLSIIDLHTGHQPISNEDGTVWVVFNGEIYNFQTLRTRLIAQGHTFRTASDTEVLIHLYEQEGTDGLASLRGMFAFAIWDSRKRRLFLARDRFGKKPLYYAHLPQGFYFGSELKCLRLPGIPLDLDREALQLYFQFRYIPDPYTPHTAIRRLPAGSWLTYDVEGRVASARYWRLPPPAVGPSVSSEEEAASCLRSTLDEAVKLRMIADVPLGAFLSGGIDSSSVVASMALQSSAPVKTFSIGFEESEFNELKYAALVAQRYGTDHHEIVVRPDSVDLVQRLVRHFDEPFGDSSAIPTFIVSEFAASHVKVVLTGDGGDELFGGYDSFLEVERRRMFDRVPPAARRAISHVADWLPYSAYGKNYLRMLSRPTALERYFESNYTPYFLRQALLQPAWMLPADAAFLPRTLSDSMLPNGADPLSRAMYFEATANLTGDMLVKVDRMSMANSLEVRCPLLDQEVARLASSMPASLKIRDGRGKHILIRALGDRLPPELLQRPKMGFGMPLAAWFRGPLREMLRDHVTGPRFLARGIVSPPFVHGLLDEHQSGRRDNNGLLWSLLMLELWFVNMEAHS
ncbi:MAG TPA: asparagine synthase (glutamine-hydrolyzing) [Vicinamibacterales bacterium]|nr:asparagine synthase (glutamine-hydrolyzing) [Vicinamibacterales bacterium]